MKVMRKQLSKIDELLVKYQRGCVDRDSETTPTVLDLPEYAVFCDEIESAIDNANGLTMRGLKELFSEHLFAEFLCDALDSLKSAYRINETGSVLRPCYVIQGAERRTIKDGYCDIKVFWGMRKKA